MVPADSVFCDNNVDAKRLDIDLSADKKNRGSFSQKHRKSMFQNAIRKSQP